MHAHRGGGARLSPNFEMEAVGAISELAQSLRGCELRRITRSDFETTVRKHLSGSHADQQIAQLWDKVSRSVTARWLIITKAKGLSCAGMRRKGNHRPRRAVLVPLARDAAEGVHGQSSPHSPPPSPPHLL